jgi:LuxR family transcriptional regulator, maltose regulon positive regulatory protein
VGPAGGMVVVDEGELARLPGVMNMYPRRPGPGSGRRIRHHRPRPAGDPARGRTGRPHPSRGIGSHGARILGSRRPRGRAPGLLRGRRGLQRTGHIADVLGCSITLADIRITQGRLSEALRTYEQALRLASNRDGTVLRGTADMHVGMSQIACERDDLAAATRHLLRAEELGEHTWLPQNPYRWRVAMARVRAAEGDLDGARRGAARVHG